MLAPVSSYHVALQNGSGTAVVEQPGSAQPGRVWPSLQALIDAAPERSRIELADGIYRERLYIDKLLHLVAADTPDFDAPTTTTAPGFGVVFDGEGATQAWNGHQALIQVEYVFREEAIDPRNGRPDSFQALISGIEFRNNGSAGDDRLGQAAGLSINQADVIVDSNYFHDLQAYDGAALLIRQFSRAQVVNNLIWNNGGTRWGAVVDTRNDAGNNEGTIYLGNSFIGNTAKEGSALFHDFGGGVFLNNLVAGNVSAGLDGGAIDTPALEAKGALMLRKDSTLSVLMNTFSGNQVVDAVDPNSGAINIETEGSTNVVQLNVFAGNAVERGRDLSLNGNVSVGRGGAIGIFNQSTPLIEFNLFTGNQAGYGGSAIASSERALPIIRSNLFLNNVSEHQPVDRIARMGAGTVFLEVVGNGGNGSEFAQAGLYSNYFEGNRAAIAPGLYIGDQAGADVQRNTFANGIVTGSGLGAYNPSGGGLTPVDAQAILIDRFFATNDSSALAHNTYVGPQPATLIRPWIFNAAPTSQLTINADSFAVSDTLRAFADRNVGPTNIIPGSIDNGTAEIVPLANANPGASSFPITPAQAALASNATHPLGDNPFLSQDFEGYDRQPLTVNGAVEINRGSLASELNAPVWRFRDTTSSTPVHFYTSNPTERDIVQNTSTRWEFEGQALNFLVANDPVVRYGNTDIDILLDPVFRILNTQTGTHLYTANLDEVQDVLTGLPHYAFEGIAFYSLPSDNPALSDDTAASAGVYRFFNPTSGTHFYSPNPIEVTQQLRLILDSNGSQGFRFESTERPTYFTGINVDVNQADLDLMHATIAEYNSVFG